MERKQLSVFIDESGDFGTYEKYCPYYIVSMVLHEQDKQIKQELNLFSKKLSRLGFNDHAIHTAPLIRMDNKIYQDTTLEKRRQLFTSLFSLAQKLPIHYLSATIVKDKEDDEVTLSGKLTKTIVSEIKNNYEYFSSFDKITVYYDNGQVQLTKIIVTVFNSLFSNVEMRKVIPSDYRLFQIADLFCTIELINTKRINSRLSHSEKAFFTSGKDFNHNYYKDSKKKYLKT